MSQGYISEYLFHFIGKGILKQEDQYKLLKKIIEEGWLSFYPHDRNLSFGVTEINSMVTRKLEEMFNPNCVCFADIPLKELSFHSSKYGKFGIGFTRDFLVSKGANPVFYIEKNSVMYKNQSGQNDPIKLTKEEYYQEYCSKTIWYFLMRYLNCQEGKATSEDLTIELSDTWEILKFLINIFSHLKPWNDRLSENDPDNFYYEREWRTLNNVNFALSDIKVICLPIKYIDQFKRDFPSYQGRIESI